MDGGRAARRRGVARRRWGVSGVIADTEKDDDDDADADEEEGSF